MKNMANNLTYRNLFNQGFFSILLITLQRLHGMTDNDNRRVWVQVPRHIFFSWDFQANNCYL